MILGKTVRVGAARADPNLTQGSLSKQRAVRSSEFDVRTPVDVHSAVQQFKGNYSLFFTMLARFRNEVLINQLNQIAKAMDEDNVHKVKELSQSLKTKSGQVGAGLIHYDCYFI